MTERRKALSVAAACLFVAAAMTSALIMQPGHDAFLYVVGGLTVAAFVAAALRQLVRARVEPD